MKRVLLALVLALTALPFVSVAQTSADQSQVPSVFKSSVSDIDKIWQQGFDDADHRRNVNEYPQRYAKGIGQVRQSWAISETVSWLFFAEPEIYAYAWGYRARRNFESKDQIAKEKQLLRDKLVGDRHQLNFIGDLRILPSKGGLNGQITRGANLADIKDVHVVLKIDGNIVQPLTQPGDLSYVTEHHDETLYIPESSTTETSGSIGGTGFASSSTNYYYSERYQGYDGYHASFSVSFPIFDSEGKCIFGPTTKEIEAIVVYGPNERHVKFTLEDIAKAKGRIPSN